ncbi:MAG: 50S ribosomal protein L6 [Clostridiaceae bacterium]|nr:50S ribosomal protein L6 [Clostridiaceae bacterium]
MSRVGKMPIDIPKDVTVSLENGNKVTVKGPKGTLTKEFHKDMIIEHEGGQIVVKNPFDDKFHKSLHGLTRSLINNMVIGVTRGFEKALDISGVGYRAQKQGKKVIINLGYSRPVEIEEPEGIVIEVPAPNKIIVKGSDKQAVGECAAIIRSKRKPSAYLADNAIKGIKYENEIVRTKAGKAGAK